MIDIVLRVETSGANWRVEVRGTRSQVRPLTDADLAAIPGLPPVAQTWDGLLERLAPNDEWQPDERTLTALGKLLRNHLITGSVAARLADIERKAATARTPIRYVIHVFEGEEDGLLPRLPFELLHDDGFWFRRAGVIGVRRAPSGGESDVVLKPGATAIVAWASMPDRRPDDAELQRHAVEVAATLTAAEFVPQILGACTRDALRAALEPGCDLLYLICHGNEDWDSNGRLALAGGAITGTELGEALQAATSNARRVQAVLLCACSSAAPGRAAGTMGMAQYLASGEQRAVASLGFRAPVEVAWALIFMGRVIHHLGERVPLEEAVSRARQAERVRDPQWALPLLFVREREPQPIHAGLRTPRSGLKGPSSFPSRLPPRPRDYFTARGRELALLRAWARTPGAAVLTAVAGEGGVGKTEIARVLAHEHADFGAPVLWLERADTDLTGALATMIRVKDPDYRPQPTDTVDDMRASMTAALGGIRGLLILDDLTDGSVVSSLTPGDGWNVLVTSRDRSILPDTVPVEVGPLDPVDALKLLARLVHNTDEVPAEDTEPSRRLVSALACLPLTIEVASSLLRKGHTIEEIIADLDATRGAVHDVVARVLGRSVDLLQPDDRRAWYLIAALPSAGVTDEDIATAMSESVGRATRRLHRLRDANLVRFDASRARYSMHPLGRQYARLRSTHEAAWSSTLEAAAEVVVKKVAWCTALFGSDSTGARRRWSSIREFMDSLAIDFWTKETVGADRIAVALVSADQFRVIERSYSERLVLVNAALGLATSNVSVAAARRTRGDLSRILGDHESADQDFATALTLMEASAQTVEMVRVHILRGELRRNQRDFEASEQEFRKAFELLDKNNNELARGNVHGARGEMRGAKGDADGAEEDFERALELLTRVRSRLGQANVHRARAELRARRRDFERAEGDLANALTTYEAIPFPQGIADALRVQADMNLDRGHLEAAFSDYTRAKATYDKVGSLSGQTWALVGLARIASRRGQSAHVLQLITIAEPVASRCRDASALKVIAELRDQHNSSGSKS